MHDLVDSPPALKPSIGLFSATMLVAGVMIGSGIFIVSADIARQLTSPGLMLWIWVFTGLVTLCGAWSYGKLATAFPQAGGQYVFLRRAWGDLPAFLYGWALFFIIQTGTVAAVAVAFAKYLGVFMPSISAQSMLIPLGPLGAISTQQGVALAVISVLTLFNIRGVQEGAWLQNIFTLLKVLAVLGLVILGISGLSGHFPSVAQWHIAPQTTLQIPLISAFAVATVGALFSSDAWNNVTFIGSEVKSPEKNLARAMTLGALVVVVLYFLVNIAYLNILPFETLSHAPEDRVASAAMKLLFGPVGEKMMAGVILISTFGCLNGLILAGARVFYAMACDGLFFSAFRQIHPRFLTPTVSLVGQGLCAMGLALMGSYNQLLDYAIFTALLFYLMTIGGLLKLAKTHASQLKMTHWSSWIIPCVYLILVSYVVINLALYKSQNTLWGLIIIVLGIPIFALWQATHRRRTQPIAK